MIPGCLPFRSSRYPVSRGKLFLSDSFSFGAVIGQRFPKPLVLEGFVSSDALSRVVHEDLLQEIQELPIELGVRWYRFLSRVRRYMVT